MAEKSIKWTPILVALGGVIALWLWQSKKAEARHLPVRGELPTPAPTPMPIAPAPTDAPALAPTYAPAPTPIPLTTITFFVYHYIPYENVGIDIRTPIEGAVVRITDPPDGPSGITGPDGIVSLTTATRKGRVSGSVTYQGITRPFVGWEASETIEFSFVSSWAPTFY